MRGLVALIGRLRCVLGLHRWQKFRTADGDWYERCKVCGKFSDVPKGGPFVFRQ